MSEQRKASLVGLGLAADEEHHGGEKLGATTVYESVSSDDQRFADRVCTLGNEAEGLESLDCCLCSSATDLGHSCDGEVIPDGLAIPQATGNGVVPGDLVTTVGKILLVLDLETNRLEGVACVLDGAHLGDTITDLDTVSDALVLGVGRVPLVGHAPFVDTENSSRLEDLLNLAVDALEVGSVAGSLDGVNGIESVLAELLVKLHEITLDELDLSGEAGLLGVLACTLDLVIVVVETNDVDVGETSDLTSGTTDTATDIEDAHLGLESHLVGKVVLVTGDGLHESLTGVVTSKVEVLTPAVLVEVGGTIVVAVDDRGVFSETVLLVGGGVILGVLLPELGVVGNAFVVADVGSSGRHF